MPEVIISTFDTHRLSHSALKLMKSAVMYAERRRQFSTHTISINEFCKIANLPTLEHLEFIKLVKEACKAIAIVETVDSSSANPDDLPYASWPVFERVEIDKIHFSFKVSCRTFKKSLMEILQESPT